MKPVQASGHELLLETAPSGDTALYGFGVDDVPAYRYELIRRIGHGGRRVAWVMLNPSTATAIDNDPTIRRCVGYSCKWGFGEIAVYNLFGLRHPSPTALYRHPDPVGAANDEILLDGCRQAQLVICAWGNHGALMGRGAHVVAFLDRPLHALRITKDGQPGHPLYLPAELEPQLIERRTR